jgi:hypothetical protein
VLETRLRPFRIYRLWLRVGYATPPEAARRPLSGCTISNNRCSASCLQSGADRRNVVLVSGAPGLPERDPRDVYLLSFCYFASSFALIGSAVLRKRGRFFVH